MTQDQTTPKGSIDFVDSVDSTRSVQSEKTIGNHKRIDSLSTYQESEHKIQKPLPNLERVIQVQETTFSQTAAGQSE
jgi:hypothetical protein